MSLDFIMQLAQKTAQTAGKYALNQLGRTNSHLKTGGHLVTDVDRHCQQLIIDQITQHYPDHGLLAEEDLQQEFLCRPPTGPDDLWWIIDPIDGTRNYAHGSPHYGLCIAALHRGIPVIGVIYIAATDTMFSAVHGQPAYRDDEPIQCRDELLHRNSSFTIPGHSYGPVQPAVTHFMENYSCVALGCAALHYAYLAAGIFTASCSWLVKLWDIAAGVCICQSAGATVTDMNGRPIFPFDCQAYAGQPLPIIIASPTPHREILNIIGNLPPNPSPDNN